MSESIGENKVNPESSGRVVVFEVNITPPGCPAIPAKSGSRSPELAAFGLDQPG